MKYINYLFLFSAFIFSTSVFAQQTQETQRVEASPLSPNCVEGCDYESGELFFNFQAEEQGVLIIALRNPENIVTLNVAIRLYDQYYQKIDEMDKDQGGRTSAEQGIFIIPGPGDYVIGVEQTRRSSIFGEETEAENAPETKTIRMTSAFMPTSSFTSFGSSPSDRDNNYSPDNAAVLSLNNEESAVVGGSEDLWDWWKMDECEFLKLTASTEQGDIVLEYYDPAKNKNGLSEIDNAGGASKEQTGRDNVENLDILQSDMENPIVAVRVRPFYEEQEVQYRIRLDRCLITSSE